MKKNNAKKKKKISDLLDKKFGNIDKIKGGVMFWCTDVTCGPDACHEPCPDECYDNCSAPHDN